MFYQGATADSQIKRMSQLRTNIGIQLGARVATVSIWARVDRGIEWSKLGSCTWTQRDVD